MTPHIVLTAEYKPVLYDKPTKSCLLWLRAIRGSFHLFYWVFQTPARLASQPE